MAYVLLVICLLLYSCVIVESQNLVSCYDDTRCSQGDPVTSTINDCCNHGIDPPGVSYTAPGMEGCEVCPRIFGFFETSFSAIERGDAYLQQVGTISGPKINFARLNVELDGITTDDGDLDLTTTSVNVFTGSDPVIISFLFTKDLIAQEIDETFNLTLVDQGNFLAGYTTRLVLMGTILDDDIASFEITENDYSASEGSNAMMQVRINKEQLSFRLANAITFRVSPLTIDAAMARSIVVPQETLRIDDDSPVQASEEDFNTTVFEVVFPADQFIDPVGSVNAFISVVDDDINENSEQLFVAVIEAAGAINSRLLSITRNLTICRLMDNDPITIGFEMRAYTYAEPDVPRLITDVALVKEGNRLTEQTFSVAIGIDPSAGANEATLGSDFSIPRISDAGSLSLLFPPNAERISLNFFLLIDQIAEGDEAFLAFSSPSEMSIVYSAPNALSSVFRSTMITIIDNDPAIAGFEMSLYFVNESAGVLEVCVVVTNPAMDQPLNLAIPVQYSALPGSAGEDDFTAGLNRVFVFVDSGPGMPNIRRMCAEIRITNDSDLENVESFTLSLMALASGIEVSPNVTEIRILDDDVATIGFTSSSYTVNEEDGIATVMIGVLSGTLQRDVSLAISLSGGSALVSSDYLDDVSNNGMIVLNGDTSVLNVSFTIVGDSIFELLEELSASLSFSSSSVAGVTLAPTSAEIIILDNDELEFGFVPSELTVAEEIGSASVLVDLISGMLGGLEITVTAATDDGSATTAGMDYTAVDSVSLEYSAVTSLRTFDITILEDTLTERLEFFFAQLTGYTVTRGGSAVSLSPEERGRIVLGARSQINIIDNDVATLGFLPTEYSMDENNGPIEFSFGVLVGELDFSVELEFFTSDGTATSSSDYTDTRALRSVQGTLVTVPVDLTDDESLERVENFFGNLRFADANSSPSNVILDPVIASAEIIDDDEVIIGFDSQSYTIDETEGEVIFNVTIISGILTKNIEVDFFTSAGSAEAPGDYTPLTTVLTFGPNQSFNEVSISVLDDMLLELVEMFNGNLRVPSTSNIILNPAVATATIIDNDNVVIGFPGNYEVIEGVNRTVTIELVVLSGTLGREVVVSVSTADGSAIAPGDYNQLLPQLVTFIPGQSSASIVVGIVDDDFSENPIESFSAMATLVSTDSTGIIIDPTSSIINILDDEELDIGFDSSTYEVVENERFVNVTIVLDGRTSRDILITLSTRDGSAISIGMEADFVSTTQVLTFSPSPLPRQAMVIQIAIINDNFVEYVENLDGVLTLTTTDDAINLQPSEASISIIDDDAVVIGFDQVLYMVNENENAVDVIVRVISGNLRIPVEVTFTTADNTASTGSDYLGVTPTILTFDESTTSFTLTIPILNDAIHEGDEEFFGRLTTSEDSNVVMLNSALTRIEILDDDEVTFSFRVSVQTVVEGVGVVAVYIDRVGNTDKDFILMLTGPLQAETGMRVDRQITFPSTDSELAITFTLIDDSIALEPTEGLLWSLSLSTMTDRAQISPFNTSNVQIVDDDELVLELVKSSGSVLESENAEACISFSTAFAMDFSINVGNIFSSNVTVDGIATPGTDFMSPSSVLAEANVHGPSTDLCFNLAIEDDNAVEVEECFSVSISLPSPESDNLLLTIDDDSDTSLCCITDNDIVVIGFQPDTYTVRETDGSTSLTITVISGILERPVEVFFSTSDGTATSTAPLDFNPLTDVSLQFDASTTSQTVMVTIVNDDILENSETFSGNLMTSDSAVNFVFQMATVTILEEAGDEVTIGFSPVNYTVNEVDGSVTLFAMLLFGTLEREVIVQFSTIAASASETDYEARTFDLTFSSTISQVVINVQIIDDTIVENSEHFFGTLQAQGTPVTVITSPDMATVVISEDTTDEVTIGFEQIIYSVEEGDTIEVCAIITSGSLERDAEVVVTSSDLTATGIDDYMPLTFTFTFDDQSSRSCIDVITIGDTILENDEEFTLTLSTSDNMIELRPDAATVSITDNDRITVGLVNTAFFVEEDGASVEVCATILNGELERNAEIELVTSDDMAMAPDDYTELTVTLTFTPMESRVCSNISIENDALYEGPEDFLVRLSTTDTRVDLIPDTARITIEDDDVITIGFVTTMDSVMENTPGFIDIFVRVLNNGMLQTPITVSYLTDDASAANTATSGNDYIPEFGDLIFTPANQNTSLSFRVGIVDDIDSEGTEVFLAQLFTDQEGVLLITDEMTVVIADNDITTIGFINPPYSGREDEQFATLTVGVISGNLDRDVVIRLTTEDTVDGASESSDYTPLNQLLTFNGMVTAIEVNVTLVDDGIVEGNEIFQGMLSVVTPGNIVDVIPSVSVTILDDDQITIGLDVARVTVDEDVGMIELCASAVGELEREVVVSVAYQDRGAIGGSDFEVNTVMLTFAPGILQNCFNVTITDDDLYENPEEFFVNITTTDPQVLISTMTSVVTIIDDDRVVIGWEMTIYSQSESAGPVELCAVILSGTLAVAIPAINIGLVDGSAVAGDDYDAQPSRSFFAFSSTTNVRMCTTVTIFDDDSFEEDVENFFANLALASTAPRVMIDPSQAEIQINDDDIVVIGFSTTMYNVNEGDGTVPLVVEVISGSLSIDVQVTLETSDGQAIANPDQDYNTSLAILTFSSTVSSQSVDVTINDDTIDENDELFIGNLLSATNPRVQLNPTTADILIMDNDMALIGFERTVYMISENNSHTAEICVRVITPPTLGRDVFVTVMTEDGTATAPADYNAISMELTFDQDNLRGCVQIGVVDDGIIEGMEVFNVVLTSDNETTLSPDTAIIQIVERETILVMFDEPSYTFNEDDGTVSITVVKAGNSDEPFTIRVTGGPSMQTDVTNSAPEIDETITFGLGDMSPNSIQISLILTDDQVALEAVEMFRVNLEIITGTNIVMLGIPDETTINVIDNDVVTVNFGTPNVTVPESSGTFMLCVDLDKAAAIPVTVDIDVQEGSATEGSDFLASEIPDFVTIPVGELQSCFTTESIQDDSESQEPDESFTLRITPRDNEVVGGTTTTTEVTIIDDDVLTIRFERPTYTFNEELGIAEVCLIKDVMTSGSITINDITTSDISTTVGSDYIGGPYSVTFGPSANDKQCIAITILTDSESEASERFSINIDLPLGGLIQPGSPSTTIVTIEDVGVRVNDTVIGDPLYTVPILVSDEQLQNLNLDKLSLCYEIHGESRQWFNLVTDMCASVNTRYISLSERLNVMNSIGVRAVDNDGQCVNIGVDVNECAATVNGVSLTSMGRYSAGGVTVRRYRNRVRISVPNCAELTLVMWVICERRTLENPDQPGTDITADMIKFVVMRGLNFGHRRAHGLLGQFWNIPVDITPYSGMFTDGTVAVDTYTVNITIGGTPRSYTGYLYQSTWDHTEESCLYVGNTQGGPIAEVSQPNDPVIADIYTAYKVPGAYSEVGYVFGLFNEDQC